MSPGEIFGDRALYRLEIAKLRECLRVMKAQGIRVVDLPEVERHQPQRDDPTLGLSLQVRQGLPARLETGRSLEVLGRFRRREPEIPEADLGEAAASPQRTDRQRRIAPGRQYQPQTSRRMLQEKPEELVDIRLRLDAVVVVQDQNQR